MSDEPARDAATLASRNGVARNRIVLETQYFDLGSRDLHGPLEVGEAICHGQLLRAVRHVSDDTASHSAIKLLAPQLLAGGGIERVEIPAHIADEHHTSSCWCHRSDDGVVGLQTPLPYATVGVDRVDPSRPLVVPVSSAE